MMDQQRGWTTDRGEALGGEERRSLRDVIGRVRAALAASAWSAIAVKAAIGAVGFAALAFVGSGKAAGWLPPPTQLSAAPAALVAAPPAASAEEPAPAVASPTATPAALESAEPTAPASGITPDGKVILNVASESELCKLPGIGAKKAQRIIATRERLKGFRRVEDLRRVKGIGRKLFARLRPLVVLDAPNP